jgi:phage shock protein A
MVMGGLTRLWTLLNALVLTGIAGLEKRNPEALLELEKERLRERLMDYDNGLAAHAGLTERLMGRLRSDEGREAVLVALVTARIAAGNRDAAARAALDLKELRDGLVGRREELANAETTYRSLVHAREIAVAEAKARIEETKQAIRSMRMERAAAEILSISRGPSFDRSSATFERLREMVEDERVTARGRIRVASDRPGLGDTIASEEERRILGDRALEEFLAPPATPVLAAPGSPDRADPQD